MIFTRAKERQIIVTSFPEEEFSNYNSYLKSKGISGIGILFSDIRGKEITNRSELTSSGNTKTSENTIHKSYWFCGIDLRYRLSIHKFQLEIGGFYSVMLRKRATATGHSLDGSNAVDWEYDVEQTTSYQDAGFTVATTYPLTDRLSIGIQYTQGLINIASVHTEFPNYSYPWKNYTTQIGLKFTFKILKF